MKPAPFENVHFVDPTTRYQVRSTQPRHTEVLDPAGNSVWTASMFTGRHHLDLSPDGQYLVTSGNHYFQTQLSLYDNEELATVYWNGIPLRKVWFSDLFAKHAYALAEELGVPVKGGGWVDRAYFLRLAVDWNTSTLRFTLHTGETKSFGLDADRYQPSDPTEAALFAQLRAQPNDAGAREVYADWMEQHGFTTNAKLLRGKFVVLEDDERDHRWRLIASCAPIERCDNQGCPKRWSALSATRHDCLRRCSECNLDVYYCPTEKEVVWRARTRERLAIDASLGGEALRIYGRDR